MKKDTYFNKIKEIRDKAINASATVISAPSVMKSKLSQSRGDLKYEAAKTIKSVKGMPDYDSDGNITEGFKVRNSYKKGK